jgi:hypothetical protein
MLTFDDNLRQAFKQEQSCSSSIIRDNGFMPIC